MRSWGNSLHGNLSTGLKDISCCGGCGGLEAISKDFYIYNIYIFPKLFSVKYHPQTPHHPQQNEINGLQTDFCGVCGGWKLQTAIPLTSANQVSANI